MTTFQTNPFFPMPTGELSLELLDNNSAPTSSIEAAQNFTLRVSWNFNTNIPGWLIPVEIKAYADELGGAFDGQIGPPPVVSLPNLPSSGSADLVVPGGTLPDPSTGSSVYRIVVVMAGVGGGHDLAAFAEVTASVR
jgi:hypothetical protein